MRTIERLIDPSRRSRVSNVIGLVKHVVTVFSIHLSFIWSFWICNIHRRRRRRRRTLCSNCIWSSRVLENEKRRMKWDVIQQSSLHRSLSLTFGNDRMNFFSSSSSLFCLLISSKFIDLILLTCIILRQSKMKWNVRETIADRSTGRDEKEEEEEEMMMNEEEEIRVELTFTFFSLSLSASFSSQDH